MHGRGQGGGAHHKGFRDVLGELTPQEAEACVGECQCLGDSPVTGGTRWADTLLAAPTWEADLGSEATVPSFKSVAHGAWSSQPASCCAHKLGTAGPLWVAGAMGPGCGRTFPAVTQAPGLLQRAKMSSTAQVPGCDAQTLFGVRARVT